MQLPKDVIDELVVRPGRPAHLAQRGTGETSPPWPRASDTDARQLVEEDLEAFRTELAERQGLLYASGAYAVLLILQGLDTAGKDGTIKHVMSGVNPQGCEVVAFKSPSVEELGHDFLWRCERVLPARGRIGIFNRSYYEEVLVTRVHPELLAAQHLPPGSEADPQLWDRRFEDINAFERHLHRSGTRIVKVFLHLSKAEQRKRLLERLNDPSKVWKFSAADLAERAYFEDYTRAYEDAISATSTSDAPWYVVPADHKPAARALVGGVLAHALEELDLPAPKVGSEQQAGIDAARAALLAE